MDFKSLINQAESKFNQKVEELELSIKEAKKAELNFLEEKSNLNKKAAVLRDKEKAIDLKIAKLEKLEAVKKSQDEINAQIEKAENMEKAALKMQEKANDVRVEAEHAVMQANKKEAEVKKAAAKLEEEILDKFRKIIMEA